MRRLIAVAAAMTAGAGLGLVVAGPAAANFVSPTPAANSVVAGQLTVTSDKLDNGSLCVNKNKANTTFSMLNSSNATVIAASKKDADSTTPSWGPYDTHLYPNGTYTLRIVEEKRSGTLFCSNSSTTTNRTITIKNVVDLAYSGATSARRNTNATVKATLTDPNLSTSVLPSRPVSFALSGSGSVTGTTNASGVATASLPVTGAARTATLTVTFAATAYYAAETVTVPFTVLKNTSATTVAAPAAVVHGQATSFTASVAAGEGTGVPSGSVQFKVDGADFGGPAALDATGTATSPSTASLSTGSHSVTAVYAGDAGFEASTSGAKTQVVAKAATTTALTSSGSPTVSGQGVTFTAEVSVTAPGAGTPSGGVQFNVDGQPYGTAVPLVGGHTASLSIANLDPGNHEVDATYNGDADFASSGSNALTHGVDQAATTLDLTSSNPNAVSGEGLTYTAAVAAVAPGAGTPSGTVQFYVDGDAQGAPVAVQNGSATSPVIRLTAGTHAITADYQGDVRFSGSSDAIDQDVARGESTTTISTSPNPSVFGQPVHLSATIDPVGPASGHPSGTLQWYIDGDAVGAPVDVVDGVAEAFSIDTLSRDTHTIHAVYSGDAEFGGSTSPQTTQTVNKAATKTTVTTSGTPSVFGQPVTFTATVSVVAPGAGDPAGTITFTDGSTVLGTQPVSSATGGQASITVDSLSVAQHAITATYDGDDSFQGSNGSVTQKVQRAQTSTVVTSSANPAQSGQGVKFTAQVSPVAPGAGAPSGTVRFTINGAPLGGAVTLVDGQATSSAFAALTPGIYKVQATYSGDGNFVGSSGLLDQGAGQSVTKGTTSMTLDSDDASADYGQTVTLTATVDAVAPATRRPTGVVQFWEGDVLLGATSLAPATAAGSSEAEFSTSSLTPGAHAINAVYVGNFNFEGNSTALQQAVGLAPTVTGVESSANPIRFGQSVTLTAVVGEALPTPGQPTGTVTFRDGGTVLGTAPVSTVDGRRQASLTVSGLHAGTHQVKATYDGDATFAPSTSSAFTQQVNRAATTLVAETVVRQLGDHGAELKATLTGADGEPLPGRTVVFSTTQSTDHSTIFICQATTDANGRAVCGETVLIPANLLDVGYDARFAGDADYLPAQDHQTYFYSGD